jgi:hypothetical protein
MDVEHLSSPNPEGPSSAAPSELPISALIHHLRDSAAFFKEKSWRLAKIVGRPPPAIALGAV